MRESYLLYKEKLQGEYFRTFDKIEVYCLTHMDEDRQEGRESYGTVGYFFKCTGTGKKARKWLGKTLKACEE